MLTKTSTIAVILLTLLVTSKVSATPSLSSEQIQVLKLCGGKFVLPSRVPPGFAVSDMFGNEAPPSPAGHTNYLVVYSNPRLHQAFGIESNCTGIGDSIDDPTFSVKVPAFKNQSAGIYYEAFFTKREKTYLSDWLGHGQGPYYRAVGAGYIKAQHPDAVDSEGEVSSHVFARIVASLRPVRL